MKYSLKIIEASVMALKVCPAIISGFKVVENGYAATGIDFVLSFQSKLQVIIGSSIFCKNNFEMFDISRF